MTARPLPRDVVLLPTGEDASVRLLARLHERVAPVLPTLVAEFYERLLVRASIAEVVARLSPDELESLMLRQGQHLEQLVSPSVTDSQLRERSREIGRVHAMVGVEIDWYVDAIADHRETLLRLVREVFHGDDLALAQTIVGDRVMRDLQGALLGYRDLDGAQHRVMLSVTQAVADARTVVDLTRGVLEALSCLDGISVGFFGRPDADGRLQFEIGAGAGLDALIEQVTRSGSPLITIDHSDEHGQGPAGRAWRTGAMQRCDSYMTDPSTLPWRDLGRRYGWRSSVAIPLADRRGSTRAMLMLYARWPGYFASEACSTMLQQIKQSLESALADLEEVPSLASRVTGYVDRATHLKCLADGAVEMLYQPLVSLPDGRLSKLEALARLRAADGRLVTPAEFLPAFGDDELFDLFEQGVHQSLAAVSSWEAKGLRTGVSVNLPAVSAQDDRYARLVDDALRHYGLSGDRLTLELLETGFVDRDAHQQHQALENFKELGVRLSQDDLGSGYSSLLRLRHFSFDDVKIDQSLVRGTELSPGAALHFIEPINDIAHSLGLSVVIEGLEDDGLIEAGVQLGVDEGQGYGIARPMPLNDVLGWVRDYRLDVDPAVPRTPVGALAAHVAWERRITARGDHHVRGSILDLDTCALTPYLLRAGVAEAFEAHLEVHGEAVVNRGGVAHRSAWRRLATLVSGATAVA